jgi:hypothetical protein
MKRTTLPTLRLAVAAVSLGACGYSQGDRAFSGAAIGGAGGAAIGASTDPKQLNLGRPAWR